MLVNCPCSKICMRAKIAKHSKTVKVKLRVAVYELALNRKGFWHAKYSSAMVIQYFLPLHLNPGGVDYEDFIQQSMSLDFTFDNSRKKVMKMFFQWCSKALLVSTLCPLFFLYHFPPPSFSSFFTSFPSSPLCSPLPPFSQKQISFYVRTINSIPENVCLLCDVLSIHTTKEKCWTNSAVHNHLHHKWWLGGECWNLPSPAEHHGWRCNPQSSNSLCHHYRQWRSVPYLFTLYVPFLHNLHKWYRILLKSQVV